MGASCVGGGAVGMFCCCLATLPATAVVLGTLVLH
jgi:hypothetical protein